MSYQPLLSIVIPAYNEERYIGACLDSLAQQTYTDFEIIVVDNNCTDKTAEIANAKSTTLNVQVVTESQKGIAFARKKGFAEAKGEIIVSTDSDCTFPENWLEKIVDQFDESKDGARPESTKIVAVYGIGVLSYASDFQKACSKFGSTTFLWLTHFLGKPNICGFNFAVRKSAYEASPTFDTSLALSEDVVLGLDLTKQGTVHLDTSLEVYASPRRFEKGSIQALWTYTKAYFQVVWLNQRPTNHFEDIR